MEVSLRLLLEAFFKGFNVAVGLAERNTFHLVVESLDCCGVNFLKLAFERFKSSAPVRWPVIRGFRVPGNNLRVRDRGIHFHNAEGGDMKNGALVQQFFEGLENECIVRIVVFLLRG